ncbi:MAG: ATP-binding protein [Bacteroidia bacterium]|nr:ATP-binding protein [Bacteroidia bacterium]
MEDAGIRIRTAVEVREYLVETTLKVFAILSFFAVLLLSGRAYNLEFTVSYFIQVPTCLFIMLTYLFRARLKTKVKSLILSFGLILILASGILSYGILASTKHLIILIPVFSSMLFGFRKALQVFLSVLLIYIGLGVLHILGFLQLPRNADLLVRSPSTWILDVFILLASGLVILQLVHNFLEVLNMQFEKAAVQHQVLSKQEEEYRTLFEQTRDSVFLLEGTQIIRMNSSAKALSAQILHGELLDDFCKLLPPEQPNGQESKPYFKAQLKKLSERNNMHFEIQLLTAEGKWAFFEISSSVILTAEKEYTQLILKDISSRKRQEEEIRQNRIELEQRGIELEKINEELQRGNSALLQKKDELEDALMKLQSTQSQLIETEKMASLGILTAGVAHEINNPLNFIQSSLYAMDEILEDSSLEAHIELRTELNLLRNTMQTGISRVSEIVKSLNHFSRKSDDKREPVLLSKIIQNCLAILNHELKNRVRVFVDFLENEPQILGNESKLHQVFLNLILNAAQAIPGKGEIEINFKTLHQQFCVELIDTGTGIPPQILEKIFDPFFTTKPAGKGTGLGLSIVQQIVHDHQGSIRFESNPGKGTRVILNFPILPAENGKA